jgi:hypothetical protein
MFSKIRIIATVLAVLAIPISSWGQVNEMTNLSTGGVRIVLRNPHGDFTWIAQINNNLTVGSDPVRTACNVVLRVWKNGVENKQKLQTVLPGNSGYVKGDSDEELTAECADPQMDGRFRFILNENPI